jgi:hypothetical protein
MPTGGREYRFLLCPLLRLGQFATMIGPSWIRGDVTLLGFGELFPLILAHGRTGAAILGELRHEESRERLVLPKLYWARPVSGVTSEQQIAFILHQADTKAAR